MSRVLVTGASGYIGGRLVQTLLERGANVRGLGRELAPWLEVDQIPLELDVVPETPGLAESLADVDTVIHLAGEDEIRAAREPVAALASTVSATQRIAAACASTAVSRLIYLSTVHVYGHRMSPGATVDEDMRPEPSTTYAISRLASEHLARAGAGSHLEVTVLRLTNAVGAPLHPDVDRWTLVANDLCRQAATAGQLTLRSSGTQWRDFVPLSWVCSTIATAAGYGQGTVAPGTYNLGSGRPLTVRGLAQLVQDEFERQTGLRPPLHAPDPEPSPPGPYYVSVQRLSACGLESPPLQDAVAETVRFCLDHAQELR